jgi:hypothetical protein
MMFDYNDYNAYYRAKMLAKCAGNMEKMNIENLRYSILIAADDGLVDECRKLYQKNPGCITKRTLFDESTALHLAAMNGHIETCRFLVAALPDIVGIRNAYRRIPVHCASKKGHTEICRLLLEVAPETIRRTDKIGWSVLHCAACGGHTETCRMLLDMEPRLIMLADGTGCFALHDAAREGHVETCRLLLEFGPTVFFAKNKDGLEPLQECRHPETSNALIATMLSKLPSDKKRRKAVAMLLPEHKPAFLSAFLPPMKALRRFLPNDVCLHITCLALPNPL